MTPDELIEVLNGLRSIYSWSILTLHATNAIAVGPEGNTIANGPLLLELIKHPNYWARQGREIPEYLWTFRDWAFESRENTQAVVASAEHRMFANMVCEAYELAKECANSSENGERWQRFCAQPWARFARVIRNTVNHGLKVDVPNNDEFPIAWKDLIFVEPMIGQELQIEGFFDMPHAFALVEDMVMWAHAELTSDP